MFLILKIAFKPMPHMGYDDKTVEEVSFISETSVIVIESGDLFLYRRPSNKQVLCYKTDFDVSSNDR